MKIHFIGIGGIGMSGLAKILVVRGDSISGSDQTESTFPGAAIGHAASNVPTGVELVVRSAAVKDDNVEVVEARRRGIPVVKYAEMLRTLSPDQPTIAIARCPRKTTTTSMGGHILSPGPVEPSYRC